jgi:tetratricopeptide (TPR) repeat protein
MHLGWWGSLGRRILPALFVLGWLAGQAGAASDTPRTVKSAIPHSVLDDTQPPRLGGGMAMSQFLDGMLQEQRGDFAGAAVALHHAYLIDPHSTTLLRALSRSALHAGDVESAVRYASDGIRLDPTDARLRFLRGSIYQALRQDDKALTDFQAAVENDTTTADFALALGRQYEKLDHLPEARESYELAFRHADPDPDDELRLAVLMGRMGDSKAAMPILDRLHEENPDNPSINLTWAWVADDLGRHQDAIPVFQQHLKDRPDDRLVRRRLINSLVDVDRAREAVPHAEGLYHSGGDLSDARLLATLYLRLEESDKARDLALDVDHRHPNDWNASSFAVALLGRAKEDDKAIELAKKTTQTAPRDYRSWMLYAAALSQAERPADAVAALERSQAILPDSTVALVELGRAYTDAGQTARAESLLVRAMEQGADTVVTWYDIASAREKAKDFAGAETAIGEVLKRQPDNSQALNFLGYLYADYNKKADQAVPLLKRALALDPENGFIMDSLGWAYYRIGSLDSARVELEQAIKASGEDPTILEHLGDVYVAMRLVPEAKARYRRALEIKPDNPPLRAKLEKLR